jgi:hypothetical protein
MKRLHPILIALLLMLSACVSENSTVNMPANTEKPIPTSASGNPDEPVSSDTATTPQPDAYQPSPADEALIQSPAYIDSAQLLTLESYPLQFMLNLEGNLPTPCHQLRIAVAAPDAENNVRVEVYSVTNPDLICTQVLAPFTVNYSLGSFPQGSYSLWVNGEKIADFQS